MKHIKRISALVLAMLMFFTCSIAFATPLYEKYEYKENYQYQDEFIAYALKATVPMIFLNCSATLRYAPIEFDVDLVMEHFEILYNEYHTQYSQEEIAQALYEHVCNNLSDYLSYGNLKTVDTEGSFTGSGVVISDNGYIATNSHVVTLEDEGKELLYMSALDSGVKDDLENLLNDVQRYDIDLTEEQVEEIYMLIMEDAIKQASIVDEDTELLVCFPTADGNTKLEDCVSYKARVVAEGTAEGVEGLTQDTAIIKIDAENLVALRLSETYPELNSPITSGGFPGASDEIFREVDSFDSVLSITVGSGQISRIVPIDGQHYKAIGINTNISGGNSGGPSVDKSLEIEGLNTYGNATDMRYAYMVSAEYVRKLADEFDIEQGEASKTFLLGLQLLQDGHGKAALECFEAVQNMNNDTPYIETMISVAKEAPQTVPEEASSGISLTVILIIAGCVVFVAASVVTILLIVKSKKKKKLPLSDDGSYVGISTEDSYASYTSSEDSYPSSGGTYYDTTSSSGTSSHYGPSSYDFSSYGSSSDYGTPAATLDESSAMDYYTPETSTYKSPSGTYVSDSPSGYDAPANPYGTSDYAPYSAPTSSPYGSSAGSAFGTAATKPYDTPETNPYGTASAPAYGSSTAYGSAPKKPDAETPVLKTTMASSGSSKPRSAPDPAFKKPTLSSGFKPPVTPRPMDHDDKTTRM